MIQCIITGCSLQLQGSALMAWGDLHEADNGTWIFNATTAIDPEVGSEIVWSRRDERTTPLLTIRVGHEYIERRGMFVMKAHRPALNDIALHRIGPNMATRDPIMQGVADAVADELVKRLSFLSIVTDEEKLKQIRVLCAHLFAKAGK